MRHFSTFLQQVRDMKDQVSGLEAEVHYARLDAVLNTLSLRGDTMNYRELGKVLGVFSAKLGAMLGRRMEDDCANGEPLSSALIVNRNSEISSPGFFEMARSLGYEFTNEQAFWEEQRMKCYDQFSEEVTVGMTLQTNLTGEENEKVASVENAIVTAMLKAGDTNRAIWDAVSINGVRIVRLRTVQRTVLELPASEFTTLAEDRLIAHVESKLR